MLSITVNNLQDHKTESNYNNEIGLPYSSYMPDDTEKLVLEDLLGDIHLLSELAHPKTAIVTLVGEAHLVFQDPF